MILLLPHRYKLIGWCMLIPAAIGGIVLMTIDYTEPAWLQATVFAIVNSEILGDTIFWSLTKVNLSGTLVGVFFIAGGLMVGFSKEKTEDEYIMKLRLSSLLWAVWVNYSLLLLAFLFIYGTAFLTVMIYNMFTVLIIFIVRFNYLLYKNAQSMRHAK